MENNEWNLIVGELSLESTGDDDVAILKASAPPPDRPLLTPIVSKSFRASAKNKLGYAHLQIASNQVSNKPQAQKAPQKSWNILTL
jgi:hypothetical protein